MNKKTVAILLAIGAIIIAPMIAKRVYAEGDPIGGGHPSPPPRPPGFVYALQADEPTPPMLGLRAIYDLFTTAGIATAIAFAIGTLTSVIGHFSKTTPKTFNLAKLVYLAHQPNRGHPNTACRLELRYDSCMACERNVDHMAILDIRSNRP